MTYSKEQRYEIMEKVVERLSCGENLRLICREEGMPAWTSLYNWVNADPYLFERLAHARILFYDAIATDCLQIADDGTNDWMEVHDKDGMAVGYKVNGEHINRSRLRIDTRLKLLAKWDPDRYGDKVTLAGDRNKPIAIADMTRQVLKHLTMEQLGVLDSDAQLNDDSTYVPLESLNERTGDTKLIEGTSVNLDERSND